MSGKKQDNGFGRDDMAALLGGGLPERLMRPQVPVMKTNKARKDVADMSTQETAAWLLQQQQQKKGKETMIQRHRTTKVRKYHELLLEEQQNRSMTAAHPSKEDDHSDSGVDRNKETEKDASVVPVITRRRRRPSTSSSSTSSSSSSGESSAPPRRPRQDSSDTDSEEEVRRQRVLQQRRQHQRSPVDDASSTEATQFTPSQSLPEAPKVMQSKPTRFPVKSSSSSSSSSSTSSGSSSDDSSSEEEAEEEVRAKPIFVPRHKRGVIQSAEELAEEEKANENKRKRLEEKRMKESRAMVQKVLLDASKQVGSNDDAFEGITGARNSVPDDDDLDEDEEYDKWEVRELERLVYELDMENARMEEARERERRRNMTDEEIMRERMESGSPRDKEESKRTGQRYFHRGAFYMDESEWDESDVRHKAEEYAAAATGADKIDKMALPKIMQVKNFGRANQNLKYQGLAAEDTTDKQMKVLPILGPKRKKNQV
ncbi:microfibrillar-associated protein 1 [Fistulifera solaris]|uniref:Microfibrillar-associated protein 1 n=1 Tax=Fistulifera solaris TaxID=1519565 RepID=A0A1Z5JU97_FISSO|nr:microfibrillar-associated protein 1 [Fistulifera solaris]|eukprot:GAX17597.1 microfibrillar-associated protein 1 [Fistulifera solaris]